MTLTPRSPVSLDAIADDPPAAAVLTPEERNTALTRCAAVLSALSTSMPTPREITATAVPRCLTVREVAERLGLKPAYIYDLVRRGELPARPIGKYERIPEDTLGDWLKARDPQGVAALMTHRVSSSSPHDGRGAPASPQAARADADPARRTGRP